MSSAVSGQPESFETRLFINGEFVESHGKGRITSYNPIDNSVLTTDIRIADQEDVDAAVAAARAAFRPWAETSAETKTKYLLKIADLLEENFDELERLDRLCTGKPTSAYKAIDFPLAVKFFRYYAGWTDKIKGDSYPAEGGFMKIIRREPIGVCATILPFNGPLVMLAGKIAPCLATGNTAIIKPSEKTSLGTLHFCKLLQKAGLPAGVVNIVTGSGSTGALISSHMNIDKICFTGSTVAGKRVAEAACTSNLKRVSLELGGKSPSIIFPDANLDNAVRWCTQGIVFNTGQVCIASSRVYVHKDIREAFLAKFKAAFEEKVAGLGNDPSDPSTVIGPVVDKAQFERVSSFIEQGKSEATLLTGGTKTNKDGCWVAPTIFVDTKQDAKIYKDEIFGPVVVVNEFSDEEDVIARANATPFGLSGAVFTQDVNRALRVASKVESGTVCINCCTMTDHSVPFGGVKQSGWGRENGEAAIYDFTETKTVYVNLTY